MKPTLLSRNSLLLAAAMLACAAAGRAADDENAILTAVFAKTAKDYHRDRDESGKWRREYYTLVNGGAADGTAIDSAQARVPFVAVATVLAQHLARQGFFPATDPANVDLLIVVNWGKTRPFEDKVYKEGVENITLSMNSLTLKSQAADRARANAAQVPGEVNLTGTTEDMEKQAAESYLENDMIMQDMMNRQRNQSNARTAHLLGYMGDINKADGPQRYAGAGDLYNELVADIEEARYYIILSAYDFNRTVRERKPDLRWLTRMSMRAPGNSFAERAAGMIAYSASRFGQDTGGLERKLYPQYKVNLEDVRFLGVAPAWRNPADEPVTKEK
jgi:hypothetical protein